MKFSSGLGNTGSSYKMWMENSIIKHAPNWGGGGEFEIYVNKNMKRTICSTIEGKEAIIFTI
jgi:hypothetical protein